VSPAPNGETLGGGDPASPGKAERRFELPDDLTPEEERAVIRALERYFAQESPHPHRWVLAGRIDAAGLFALQARHYTDVPWGVGTYAPYARRGVPSVQGRGDVR
jgi:hypothetical protein